MIRCRQAIFKKCSEARNCESKHISGFVCKHVNPFGEIPKTRIRIYGTVVMGDLSQYKKQWLSS